MTHSWKLNEVVGDASAPINSRAPRSPVWECHKSRHHSVGCIYERRGSRGAARQFRGASVCPATTDKIIMEDEANGPEPREIDAGTPPPVDDSLFFDQEFEALKHVKVDGASLKTAMWAAFGVLEMKRLLEMEQGLIERGPDNKLLSCSDQRLRNIALLWASFRGLAHLLPRLEESGADITYVEERTGMSPLHVASLSGSVACLEYLIARGADVNQVNPAIHYAPLHFAALSNSSEAAELLLRHGARLNQPPSCRGEEDDEVEPVLHCAVRAKSEAVVKLLLDSGASVSAKNSKGETPLHVACLVQSLPCAEMILLQLGGAAVDVNALDQEHRTPLHNAVIDKSAVPELVELLLKHGAAPNVADRNKLTPLHIAALNELAECVDVLIWAGADVSATNRAGLTALNIILRKIPECLQVFRQRLDNSIRLRRPVPHNREFEMRLHFELLFASDGRACETSFINTFVQEHQKDLLSHPLVMAFLHLKWEKIRKFYLMRILLYTLTVVCMTTYVLAYKCLNENNNSKICNNKRASGFLFRRNVIQIEWYVSLVLTLIMIPRKIFGFMVHKSARQYFMNIDNFLDAIVIISVFVTSFVYTGVTYDWQNYVGAFAVLCAWTNLMLMVGQLPAFGTYVAMFTHIQFEFAKLLLAYSGLLIGFTISFCVIFVGEPSFDNPLTGLIKVLAMMAGELDFEGLINQDVILRDDSFVLYHPLSVCSQILFTLFIVFVTVILMNLLVGIAVHDIQGLRNHAGLTKLVRQTKLILFSEQFLHTVLHLRVIPDFVKKWMCDHKIDVDNRKRVLVVKPLNPLEKRLPKDILKAAYEIAQRNAPLVDEDDVSLVEHVNWLKNHSEESIDCLLQTTLGQLSTQIKASDKDIRVIKEQLLDTNKTLKTLLLKARTR
ncbi:transient receptor potential channel pyrexia-like [Copidosoma floridanum]|uniref:transient receptor potential channel pyrexia-like n=1 Tax=Copidosoma floridanum TaxID=29053 RepID=UPI0006C96FFD|nr:transient receptor potential channel pyrexia-like [Copidosoma floridanum]